MFEKLLDKARIPPARRGVRSHALEQLDRSAIAAKRAHVDIVCAGLHAMRETAIFKISVDQRTEIFVPFSALFPEPMQSVQSAARQFECPPNPARMRTRPGAAKQARRAGKALASNFGKHHRSRGEEK